MACPGEKNIGTTIVYLRVVQRSEPRKGGVAHKLYNLSETSSMCTLDKRGWCFQERLLAKRILHVGQSELAWECIQTTACECQTEPTGNAEFGRWKSELIKQAATEIDAESSRTDKTATRWVWTNVVGEFTKRDLTYEKDRLDALAGMAMTMKPDAAADYVCGLWRSDLVRWLCWSVGRHDGRPDDDSPPVVSRRQPSYCAPTWSWASVTGYDIDGQRGDLRGHRSLVLRPPSRPYSTFEYG